MKHLIQQAQQYFTQKLIAGEFEIKDLNRYIVALNMEGHEFTFWIANDIHGFKQYNEYEYHNFLQLDLQEADEKAVWNALTPKIEEVKQGQWREERMKKLEEIKAELGLN